MAKEYFEEFGNYSYTPIMLNVTTESLAGCVYNRSTACLTACR